MAKRSVEENKGISGYLQEISEIKTSKNNNRYFEGKIQTESKQLQRLVVFTPDKHENYRSAATLGRPVKLINAIMTPNRSEIEVHVNRRTTMEINPEPLPFKRKLFTEEAASTSVAEVRIKDFKEPYQTVSFNFLTVVIRYWLRLPGLGNNNEKLGLPERLKYRNTIPVQEPISRKNIG